MTVLDLESNNVAELDQIEQLGTCPMLRDLTLDGNPISKRKAYRRIVGSLIPQLETLDYTEVSSKERRLLDDDVLAKLRRKCKDSAEGGSSKSHSRSNTPKHHSRVGGFSNGDSALGGGLDGTDGSRNGTPAGTPSGGSRSRRGSRRGLANASDSAISELQMVAEAIKWGNTNGIARAQSATGSPRPRRELPRRPYSSSDHIELSSQLSQYKWHREQSGHAAHMLQLLEEIGVEEGSEVSSSSGLTMGSSVTFAGNPIMAMRARRMSVGDGVGDELANVLDEGKSALGLSPRAGIGIDSLSPMSAVGSGARSPAPEPTVEDVKRDLRTWNLDAAVAKLRIRAGRPASRPGTARSQSGGPASPAVGAVRSGRPPLSVDSERTGLGDSFGESRSPARFNRHSGSDVQAEVMLFGDDRHARANDLSADSHRLMNSSRGSDAGTGDLLATSRPREEGIRRVGSISSDSDAGLSASKKATSPGPTSLFHARKPSIGWGEDGDSSLGRVVGDRPQQSKANRSIPRHDDGEDVESSNGEGEIEEDDDGEGLRTYRHLPDSELVAMLKKKPKKVPELQVRHLANC